MGTHSIGPGKVIVSVPVTETTRRDLGRLAFLRNQSLSALVRGKILEELATARRQGTIAINDVRQMALPLSMAMLVGLGMGSTAITAILGMGDDPRRVRISRTLRVRRKADGNVLAFGSEGDS